jgi:hypothetical protein
MECNICYFDYPHNDFFVLQCCKNNNVCKQCINLLITPLCPFCRTIISELSDKRMAYSYPTNSHISNNDYFINPYDDTYIDSRILRRQMKRIRKLQERERDRLYNQNIAMAYRLNKQSNKKEIQKQIKEDIFQFEF